MIKVIFIIDGNVEVEELDGNITPDYLLYVAKSKGASGCYVVSSTVIELR